MARPSGFEPIAIPPPSSLRPSPLPLSAPLPSPTAPHRPSKPAPPFQARTSRGRRLVSGTPFSFPSPRPAPPRSFLFSSLKPTESAHVLRPDTPLLPCRHRVARGPATPFPRARTLQVSLSSSHRRRAALRSQEARRFDPARGGSIAGSDRPPGGFNSVRPPPIARFRSGSAGAFLAAESTR
jgi:hypothetical protein